jgi:hypothetical protein
MNPKIISVKESRALSPGGAVQTVLNVQWTAGTFGPFTLVTNWTDLNNGTALQAIQLAAAKLQSLPTT